MQNTGKDENLKKSLLELRSMMGVLRDEIRNFHDVFIDGVLSIDCTLEKHPICTNGSNILENSDFEGTKDNGR